MLGGQHLKRNRAEGPHRRPDSDIGEPIIVIDPLSGTEVEEAPAPADARRLGKRAIAAIIDQIFSSLQNFAVLFAALHFLSPVGIGQFTIAYSSSLLVLAFVRPLVLEPLTIRFTSAQQSARRRAASEAIGSSLAIGAAIAALAILGALVVQETTWRGVLFALALAIPILLFQDGWRFLLFAEARPWAAALNDGACMIVTVGLVLAVARGSHSVAALLTVWAVGTGVGVMLGFAQCGIVPAPNRARHWFRKTRDLGFRLASASGFEFAASQVSLILVGVIAGVAAVGELGASRTLMAPLTTLTTSAVLFGIPEAAQIRRRAHTRMVQFTVALALVIVSACVLFTVALAVAPAELTRALAGKNWETARALLFPVAIWTGAAGARQGAAIGLRVMERGQIIFWMSVATSLLVMGGTIVGAFVAGAAGAAWDFAAVYVLASCAWWLVYLRVQELKPARLHVTAPAG